MTTYTISNRISGITLGQYDAETPAQALDAMARDAGYDDYAEACAVAPSDNGEIVAAEVYKPHTKPKTFYAAQRPRGFINETIVSRFTCKSARDAWVIGHENDGDVNAATHGAFAITANRARYLTRPDDWCGPVEDGDSVFSSRY